MRHTQTPPANNNLSNSIEIFNYAGDRCINHSTNRLTILYLDKSGWFCESCQRDLIDFIGGREINNASYRIIESELKKKWTTNHNTIADDLKALSSNKHIKSYRPANFCKKLQSNLQSLNSNRKENEIDLEKGQRPYSHCIVYTPGQQLEGKRNGL